MNMTSLNPGSLIYAGKSKSLYSVEDPEQVLVEFRDDATAFNALKKASLANKGKTNNRFNSYMMEYLTQAGIPNHFIRQVSETQALMKKIEIIPLEAIVRNYAAGNLAKRLGIEEGLELTPPVYELFLKDDQLGDPLINESVAIALKLANQQELDTIKSLTLRINDLLKAIFEKAGILLIDFKLEFGRFKGKIILGDEITPDGCRLWDAKTKEKFDKDRFRRDLGDVIEHYQLVMARLGIV
jgi:phosphoribosylaminoimidazole-succinocarboxamide synthase